MWVQHAFLLGFSLNVLLILHSFVGLSIRYPPVVRDARFGDHYQTSIDAAQTRRSQRSSFTIITALICGFYWGVRYLTSISSRILYAINQNEDLCEGLNRLWRFIIQPILIISLPYSLYYAASVFDRFGLIHRDLEGNLAMMFGCARNQTEHDAADCIDRLENWQASYHCCGADGLDDWIGVAHPVSDSGVNYFPGTCTDHYRSPIYTEKKINDWNTDIRLEPPSLVNLQAPVYQRGCVLALARAWKWSFVSKWSVYLISDVILHTVLFSMLFLDFSIMRPGTRHHSAREKMRLRGQHARFLFGAAGFVPTNKLLEAIQATRLFANTSAFQNAFHQVRSVWLDKGMNIGWDLRADHRHYATFVRKVNLRQAVEQWRYTGFRRFLRRSLPLVEAVIYADGDAVREPEANHLYGSFIIYFIRICWFIFVGLVTAQFLISAFIPHYSQGEIKPESNKEMLNLDKAALMRDVGWIAAMFIRVIVIIGSVGSKRFRCLLVMLIPSLGLTIGQSYLGSELVSTALYGPGANIERNLRATSRTLTCLIQLGRNISGDAKQFYDDVQQEDSMGESKSFVDNLKTRVNELNAATRSYVKSINKLRSEMLRAKKRADKANDALVTDQEEDKDTVVSESDSKFSQAFSLLSKKFSTEESNKLRNSAEQTLRDVNEMIKNMRVTPEFMANVSKNVEQGTEIESNIRRQLILICMNFKKAQAMMCVRSATAACDRVQKFMTVFPVRERCRKYVLSGIACPDEETIVQAAEECGSEMSKLNMKPGFGVAFSQSYNTLTRMADSFKFTVKLKTMKVFETPKWVKQSKEAVLDVGRKTRNAAQALFYMSILLSTSLKLLALLVFYKAMKYTHLYLTDPDFDNIYVAYHFEAIDFRRHKKGRETLLPLKDFECKKVFWKRVGYTKAELTKALTALIKVGGLGLGLLIFFFVDFYLTEAFTVLDAITTTNIQIGGGSSSSSISEGDVGNVVEGDGIFYNMITSVVGVIQRIGQINLNYQLSECSPNVSAVDRYHKIRFGVLWFIMLTAGIFSGYLMRARHHVLDFFYPGRAKKRAVHLYNTMLVDRRRHMTICRNLIVHHARIDRLQEEAEEKSVHPLTQKSNPVLEFLMPKAKINCLLCSDRLKMGTSVFVCPYDDTPVCRPCVGVLFDNVEVCVVCLDRNPQELMRLEQKLTKVKKQLDKLSINK